MKQCRIFLVAPLLLLLLAGCNEKKPAAGPVQGHALPNPRVASCEPGKPGGVFTIVAPGAPQRFNPMLAMDTASDEAVRLIFASLVTMDETTQTPTPGLAESWTNSPDGLTWTFKLRAGLHWSDGEPLTADDVVFTWNSVMYDKDLNRVSPGVFFAGGEPFKVTKLDEVTVQVVTADVFAPFLEFFGQVMILPKHRMEIPAKQHNFLSVYTLQTPPQRIACSGPWCVKNVNADGSVSLERNPEYWTVDKAGQRLPYFDEVKIVPGSPDTGAETFLQGLGDAYELSHPQESDQFEAAATNGNFRVVDLGMGTERDFLWFNQNTNLDEKGQSLVKPELLKWFRNTKFRQAVSCAIDRDRMVGDIYHGRASVVYGLVAAENSRWDNTNIAHYACDPARAKSLLKEIGLEDRKGNGLVEDSDGNTVDFTLDSNTGNPLRAQCAQQVADDLKKIGLNVHLNLSDYRELGFRIQTGAYECAMMGLAGGGSEPAAQLLLLKSDQPMHQWFPNQPQPSTDWEARIDELMDAQMRTVDFAARKKNFDEVQSILAEQLPMINTVAAWQFAAARTNLANLRPSTASAYRLTWNLDELYFTSPPATAAAPGALPLSQ